MSMSTSVWPGTTLHTEPGRAYRDTIMAGAPGTRPVTATRPLRLALRGCPVGIACATGLSSEPLGPVGQPEPSPMMGDMSAVQWGTVATWVASVGTVTAVSFALWEARGDRKERLRRELRQQAVRISAWFVEMHKDPNGEDPRREAWLPAELRGRAADVELLNNSEDPVTDVLVFLSRVSYKVQRWWDQEPEYRAMIGVLPPGRWTITVPKSGGAIARVKLGGSPAMSRVMVIISFTDNAGNHWARGARGELRQLPAPAIEYWKVHKEDIDWQVPTRLD
jgi:hypothetical protein